MRESSYIPGFDWVRIIGSITIVMTHCGAFAYFRENALSLFKMLSIVIPVFFIMSGFLRERSFSRKAVYNQVLKYGAIYLAVNSCAVVYAHIHAITEVGYFSWTGLAVNLLKGLVLNSDYAVQLWFIPALIYPMLLNAFLDRKWRRIVIVISAALTVATEMVGQDSLTNAIVNFSRTVPLIGKVFFASDLYKMWIYFLTGTLYTTIGFDISSWKPRPFTFTLAAIPFAFLEFHTGHILVSPFLLSLALFFFVKEMPGQFMYPYHAEISLFSAIMYFAHSFEKIFIQKLVTDSIPWIIIIIIVFNLGVTIAVSRLIKKDN